MSSGIASLPRSWSRLAVRIRSSSPFGRSTARPSATDASAIIVDGLPDQASRPASAAISASCAASIADRPTSSARERASELIGARRTVPSSPVSRNT